MCSIQASSTEYRRVLWVRGIGELGESICLCGNVRGKKVRGKNRFNPHHFIKCNSLFSRGVCSLHHSVTSQQNQTKCEWVCERVTLIHVVSVANEWRHHHLLSLCSHSHYDPPKNNLIHPLLHSTLHNEPSAQYFLNTKKQSWIVFIYLQL